MTASIENQGFVRVCIKNNIATITFYHPASNSFPSVLLQQLVFEIDRLGNDESVHILVLKSEKTTFCAGASFDELLEIDNTESGTIFFSGFANVLNAMRRCPKLIIGRVQGKSVGGGVGIIAACDHVVAIESSALKLSEIAIGIGPFVIEPAISRKIGITAFAEMSLSPTQWFTSRWSLDKGLFNKVVQTIEELDQEIDTKAAEFASYSIESLIEIKKILWQNTSNWDNLLPQRAAISGSLVVSIFSKKALAAFKK